jgi:hypothetical protein
MHRRPLGRGRQVAGLAAIAIVIGCFLPWWEVGGGVGQIPAVRGNGFEGSGIVVFFSGLATIALLALPYAAADRPSSIDRPLSFVIVLLAGWLGFAARLVDLGLSFQLGTFAGAILPSKGPGLWIAALGLIVLSRAVYDLSRERRI